MVPCLPTSDNLELDRFPSSLSVFFYLQARSSLRVGLLRQTPLEQSCHLPGLNIHIHPAVSWI
jgi:hypothetical protein